MAENKSNFFGKLQQLFGQSVTVRDPATQKIKVVDINNLQTYGNYESNRFIDKFTHLRTHGRDFASSYNPHNAFQLLRSQLYMDFEAMEADAIIGSALDLYAEESTTSNSEGDILEIQTDDEKIYDSLRNLFYDILNIEFNLYPWVRILCKYGDMFLKLDIIENVGVTNVIPLSPYAVERDENPANPSEVYFKYDESLSVYTIGNKNKKFFHDYEIAHFRLLTDTNYLPYGRSILEPARRTWKQLTLLEDSMLIHRIMRAPEKRIFKIDIGNIPPNEVDAHMAQVIDQMKKVPLMDNNTGEYNLKFNMQNMLEDFYLPVRGGQSGTEISTLPGMEYTGITDIEYVKNKMFAALKIPKSYFSYTEEINSKSTIAALDVRFSRSIERIQRIIASELTKIAVVHLYSQGFKDADLVNFKLSLTNPSTVHEIEKIQLWKEKVELSNNILQNKLLPREWMYRTVFNFTDEEVKQIKSDLVADEKLTFLMNQITTGEDPAKPSNSFGGNAEAEAGLTDVAEPLFDTPDTTPEPEAAAFGEFKQSTPIKRKFRSEADQDLHDRSVVGFKTNPNNRKHVRSFNGNSPLALEIVKKMKKNKKKLITEKQRGNFLDESQLQLDFD